MSKRLSAELRSGFGILKLGVGVILGADYPENCPKSRYKSWGWGEEKKIGKKIADTKTGKKLFFSCSGTLYFSEQLYFSNLFLLLIEV